MPSAVSFMQGDSFVLTGIIKSGVFLLMVSLIRFFVVRTIRRAQVKWPTEQRVVWIGYVRTASLLSSLFGLLYIWAEAGTTLLSVSAIALAMVWATREVLVCLLGSFIRFRTNSYGIGDRIEVNGKRGDVVDIGILSTLLMEIQNGGAAEQHTGRLVVVPHSVLVTAPVHNESMLETYYLHSMNIPLYRSEDWIRGKDLLLQIAKEECEPYLNEVRIKARRVARERSMGVPLVEPHVAVHLPKHPARLQLVLRVPAPVHAKGEVEQRILIRFLSEMNSKKNMGTRDLY
jgi:small-conductance mechanosensitive channel